VSIRCPACRYNVGASDGGSIKFRVKIVKVDEHGRVHGPCRKCGQDLTLAKSAEIVKSMRPAVRIRVKGLTALPRRK